MFSFINSVSEQEYGIEGTKAKMINLEMYAQIDLTLTKDSLFPIPLPPLTLLPGSVVYTLLMLVVITA